MAANHNDGNGALSFYQSIRTFALTKKASANAKAFGDCSHIRVFPAHLEPRHGAGQRDLIFPVFPGANVLGRFVFL